jgi:hypothetical protein
MWENINRHVREPELLDHPFGDVSFIWAKEEIAIGVRSHLAGVQPLPQCRALDQDCAEPVRPKVVATRAARPSSARARVACRRPSALEPNVLNGMRILAGNALKCQGDSVAQ